MEAARLRLKRIRFKDGRTIEVFDGPSREKDEDVVRGAFDSLLRHHGGPIAGCALVIWSPDNSSSAIMRVSAASKMPSIMVPDFVRNRLLAERIEQWTMDDLEAKE